MSNDFDGDEHLSLKWGTLKGWKFTSDRAKALLEEYGNIGSSAMTQYDTPRQQEIICELIDIGSFENVYLDWRGRYVSKEEAKTYVREYNRP
jgi:hypothetical protein